LTKKLPAALKTTLPSGETKRHSGNHPANGTPEQSARLPTAEMKETVVLIAGATTPPACKRHFILP
jgi:hypothetical protein